MGGAVSSGGYLVCTEGEGELAAVCVAISRSRNAQACLPCRPAGVCDALAAAIRQHEDPSLQRRAAAALGELLFYADSQVMLAIEQHVCIRSGQLPHRLLAKFATTPLSNVLNTLPLIPHLQLPRTPQHRETAAPAWDLAADAVQRLTALLQPGQDEISQVG